MLSPNTMTRVTLNRERIRRLIVPRDVAAAADASHPHLRSRRSGGHWENCESHAIEHGVEHQQFAMGRMGLDGQDPAVAQSRHADRMAPILAPTSSATAAVCGVHGDTRAMLGAGDRRVIFGSRPQLPRCSSDHAGCGGSVRRLILLPDRDNVSGSSPVIAMSDRRSFSEQLEILRAKKRADTRRKQETLGAMDYDDQGQVLPPGGMCEVIEMVDGSGVKVRQAILKEYRPVSNNPSGGFFGPARLR